RRSSPRWRRCSPSGCRRRSESTGTSRSDARGDGLGVVAQLAPGEAQPDVARSDEGGVLGPVTLEGGAGAVVAPAVDLDDEAVGREVEVDFVGAVVEVGDVGVAARLRQACAPA